ncbi:hypothetical protein [Streptomyces armeniacus]|nr:hypothetical protein [Streptomyces armeniacus]
MSTARTPTGGARGSTVPGIPTTGAVQERLPTTANPHPGPETERVHQ